MIGISRTNWGDKEIVGGGCEMKKMPPTVSTKQNISKYCNIQNLPGP